jgi:hypothetical protein
LEVKGQRSKVKGYREIRSQFSKSNLSGLFPIPYILYLPPLRSIICPPPAAPCALPSAPCTWPFALPIRNQIFPTSAFRLPNSKYSDFRILPRHSPVPSDDGGSDFPGPDRFYVNFLTEPHSDKSRCKYQKPIKSRQGGPNSIKIDLTRRI